MKPKTSSKKGRPISNRAYGSFSIKSKEYKYCNKYGHLWDITSTNPKGIRIDVDGGRHIEPLTTLGCSYCGLDCYEYISADKMYYAIKEIRWLNPKVRFFNE